MRFEVEQKFPVADLEAVRARLQELGESVAPPRREADLYYNHPSRDFAATDEAIRIRLRDDESFLTYKGPKVDATTKTRHEIDLPLDSRAVGDWRELLRVLGFRPVAEVRKRRSKALVTWQDYRIEVSLDEVEEVGSFVELELVTDESGLDEARAAIAGLAERLSLRESERRSYLSLLLSRREA